MAELSPDHRAAISAGVTAHYKAKHLSRGTDGTGPIIVPTPSKVAVAPVGPATPIA